MGMKLVIGHLFKEQLNAYGDSGNVMVLGARLKERDIDFEIREYAINEEIDFDDCDIIYLGGGRGRETRMVNDALKEDKEALAAYIERGGVLLATGSSISILGNYTLKYGEELPGLGILDLYCELQEDSETEHVLLDSVLDGTKCQLAGFLDNVYMAHHNYEALGHITRGSMPRGEGLIFKHLVATGLYGPVLAKNKDLADLLLIWALEMKYGHIRLKSLNDHLEHKLKKKLNALSLER